MLSTEGKGKGYGTLYLTSEVPLLSIYRVLSQEADDALILSFHPLYASVLRFKGM